MILIKLIFKYKIQNFWWFKSNLQISWESNQFQKSFRKRKWFFYTRSKRLNFLQQIFLMKTLNQLYLQFRVIQSPLLTLQKIFFDRKFLFRFIRTLSFDQSMIKFYFVRRKDLHLAVENTSVLKFWEISRFETQFERTYCEFAVFAWLFTINKMRRWYFYKYNNLRILFHYRIATKILFMLKPSKLKRQKTNGYRFPVTSRKIFVLEQRFR